VLPETGSAAELVAHIATGAHVVKALHLFAGASWPFMGEPAASPSSRSAVMTTTP
jgi:hypothetical protein